MFKVTCFVFSGISTLMVILLSEMMAMSIFINQLIEDQLAFDRLSSVLEMEMFLISLGQFQQKLAPIVSFNLSTAAYFNVLQMSKSII